MSSHKMPSQNLKQSKSTFNPAVHLKLGTFVFDDTYPEYPEGGIRGWTLKKHPKDEGYTLQYRKLEDCFGCSDAEVDGSGVNCYHHVHAMVQS
eukprot:scaffold104578_cov67-Attheya_sp.AAC.9